MAADAQAGFSIRTLQPVRKGAELLGTGDVFRDAAEYDGKLYLAGPGGVAEYTSDLASPTHTPTRRFRPGIELPPSPVTAIAAGVLADSHQRELLIATAAEGLIAFDGARFRQIKPDDASYGKLTALLPTTGGRLLLGAETRGVLVYDGKRLKPFHSSLNGLHITALAGDESDFWAGTLDRGAIHWHAGQVDPWNAPGSLPDPRVLSIHTAGDVALVGTPMGVALFRGGRFDRVLARGVFASALLPDVDALTIGTFDEGIVRTAIGAGPNTARVRPASYPAHLESPPHSVRSLLNWHGRPFALTEDGLLNLSTGNMTITPEPGSLTSFNISAVSPEPAGRLWVGYFDRGLDIVDGARLTHDEDDTLFCINRIARDPVTQATAVATANGLVIFDPAGRRRETLTKAQGLIADHVTDVLFRNGDTVAATPAGLTFIDSTGTHSVSAFHGLINTHVYAMARNGDTILAGTLGGLSVLNHGAVTASYNTANSGLRHNWITAVIQVGNEWFAGTYGAAVMRLTAAGTWETFPELKNANVIVNPNAMLATPSRVYVGTLGGGLLVYERNTSRWRWSNDGLPSLNVTALAANRGSIYIGTDDGLVRSPEEAIR